MTENITIGDILGVQDTHSTKSAGNTIATVIGIVGAIVVIALLWNAFVRRDGWGKSTDKETNITLGGAEEAISSLKTGLAEVRGYERQDAIKLAYTDGMLYGRPNYYTGWGGHGHGHDNGCGVKSKFQEVKTFSVDTDVATLTSTCG